MADALAMLAGSPKLRRLFCEVDDAGNPKPRPALVPPEPDPEDRLFSYRSEAVERLAAWVAFYARRADARGILAGSPWRGRGALDSLREAVAALLATAEGDDGDGAVDGALTAIYAAVDAAREAAEADAGHSGRRGTAEHGQWVELSDSPLLSIARGIDAIESLWRAARDGELDASDAAAQAADEFATGCLKDGYPPDGDA